MDRIARNDELMTQLRRLANRQLGLVTRRQALAAGATRRQVSWRAESEDWQLLDSDVYLLPGNVRTWETDALAACLRRGPSARLAYSSAARIFDLVEGKRHDRPVEVVVVAGAGCRSTDGVSVHRSRRLAPADVATFGVLPVTTVARTVLDLATRLDHAKVERLVDDSLVRGLTTVPLLSGALGRTGVRGRPGCRAVRSALELWGSGAMQSHAEVIVARWLRRSGFPAPVAQMRVKGPAGQRWYVDFGWPEYRVVAEVDSFQHHHGPRKLSQDHERKSGIEAAGWRVLTTTAAEIERGGELFKAALTRWLA